MKPRNTAAKALRTLRPKRLPDRKKVIPRKSKNKAPKWGLSHCIPAISQAKRTENEICENL